MTDRGYQKHRRILFDRQFLVFSQDYDAVGLDALRTNSDQKCDQSRAFFVDISNFDRDYAFCAL